LEKEPVASLACSLPWNEFHGQIVDAGGGPELVDGFNVGVIEFCEGESFSAKAVAGGFVGEDASRQNL